LFFHAASKQQKGSEQYNTRFWSWSKVKFYGQGEEAPRMWWSSSFCVTKEKEAARTHSMSAVRRAYYINDDVFLPSPSSTTISLSTRALTGQERKIPGTKKETATGQPAVKQIKT
jgi:hypothetical protein